MDRRYETGWDEFAPRTRSRAASLSMCTPPRRGGELSAAVCDWAASHGRRHSSGRWLDRYKSPFERVHFERWGSLPEPPPKPPCKLWFSCLWPRPGTAGTVKARGDELKCSVTGLSGWILDNEGRRCEEMNDITADK